MAWLVAVGGNVPVVLVVTVGVVAMNLMMNLLHRWGPGANGAALIGTGMTATVGVGAWLDAAALGDHPRWAAELAAAGETFRDVVMAGDARLAAVVVAITTAVMGYSALTARVRIGTMAELRQALQDVADPEVASRVVDGKLLPNGVRDVRRTLGVLGWSRLPTGTGVRQWEPRIAATRRSAAQQRLHRQVDINEEDIEHLRAALTHFRPRTGPGRWTKRLLTPVATRIREHTGKSARSPPHPSGVGSSDRPDEGGTRCGACVPEWSALDPSWLGAAVGREPLTAGQVATLRRDLAAARLPGHLMPRGFAARFAEMAGWKQAVEERLAAGEVRLHRMTGRITDPAGLPVRGVHSTADGVLDVVLMRADDLTTVVHEVAEAGFMSAGLSAATGHALATYLEGAMAAPARAERGLLPERVLADAAWLAAHNPTAWATAVHDLPQRMRRNATALAELPSWREFGQHFVFASHRVLLERVVPVHYDTGDVVEALDDVASAAGDVITRGPRGGRTTADVLARAVAAGARHRADTGNERLTQLVGQRARDLAAIADMHELRRPYLDDLLTPAAYLVYWGAAARVLPPAYAGVPSAFLRRLLPGPMATELLVPVARPAAPDRSVPEVVDALDGLLRRLHDALADAVDEAPGLAAVDARLDLQIPFTTPGERS